MSKVRVYEVAKQLGLDPKQVVALFQAVGVSEVRNHMSSVEVDAVDRLKRHLEKQKTHDVVEERIRPTVVKRRAVAKPGGAPASMPEIPAPAPSARAVTPPSEREVVAAPPSVPAERVSAPRIVPEERVSVREVAPPPPPSVPAERRSVRQVVEEPAPPPVAEVAPPPPSEPAPPVVEAAPPPPPPPVEEPRVERVERVEVVRTPPPEPAPRAAPKTGVEYWTGRPGVPMPAPQSGQRTAIGGGQTGTMPRRTEFNPRAGSGPARPGMRPMMQGGRPMGRGMQQRRGPGGGPVVPRTVGRSTQEMSAHKKVIRIEENITLATMAQKMSMKATELLMKLLSMGMSGVHINSTLDADTAKILASDFGWEVEDVAQTEEQSLAEARGEEQQKVVEEAGLELRPPVVTVMGHVDHGKTSLLDKIRKANVAAGEAGGITQHIGAYKVQTPNGTIVFLDTPGHEAFTAMRARGASVTDLVVLVVAADDGVMPQTKEAVAHAKAAEVPIIVAINKIDKPQADTERVKRELVEIGLTPEDWGGETIYVPVSAMTGQGVDQLLEMIQLQAEVLDLKANAKKAASGTVLEALLDRGRGPVARVLIQDGTLRVGDFVLAGPGFGKVRAMTNEHGKQVHEAGPATPVEILGLSEVPGAGDPLDAVKDSKKAQEIAESRKGKMAKSLVPSTARVSLEDISRRIAESNLLELRVIVKGDVQGSVEAVGEALTKLSSEKVKLAVIHAAVGAITEGDINLAIASKAIIVGFNVRPAGKAVQAAEENHIEIRLYSIIYDAVDDVRSAMEGLLPTNKVEKLHGKAEVRQIFKIKGIVVAGSHVLEGKVVRTAQARLVRDSMVVWTGKLSALKRFKDDVKDVAQGFDCGISLEGYMDIKEKDIVESFEIEEIKQKL